MSMKRSGSEVGLIDSTNTPQKKKKTRVPPHGDGGDDEDDDTAAATLGRGKRAERDKNHDNTVDVDASASESGESDDAEEDDSSTSDDDNDDTEEQDDSVDDEDEILVTTLDYKEYVDEDPTITKIPSPSPSLLAMSYGSAVQVLVEEVAIPRAQILFERLVDDGFVQDIFGPFSPEITRSERRRENDQTSKTSIVYLVTKKGANGSRKVKKAGSSKNGKKRKAKSKSKGIILEADDESMHEIFNLDLLTEEADRYVQESWYEMVEAAINHPECPPPLRHVLQTYAKRGGAGIGFAKNGILQYVELGAKIFFGAPNLDFEFFMCDAGMHNGRQQVVLRDWDQIKPILEEVYGAKAQGRINVKYGSSWPPNVSKILQNGQPRLFSTQVALESIAGHPVDILQTNMTRDPPKKKDGNGYTVQGGYSPEQLRNALETFDAKIDGLQDYDFYDLDSCTFIFPSGSLRHLVRRGFKIRCILWDDEVVLLVHPSRKVIIWLHLPYCLAAPGRKRRMASIVKRNLTIQLTTMAVAWCQGTLSTRGQMNCSFHDATLAAFSYEHAIVAAHMYEMHAAACQRDVMTPASTFALIQNDLPRVEGTGVEGTGVGVYIPVARNLRKARYKSQASKKKNRAFVIDNLCIQRALNVARRLKRMKDAKDAVKKITSILAPADVEKGAIDQRWRSFFESFVPESKLLAAIKKNLPKKKNKGNPRAKGKTKEEKAVYDSEIRQMKELQVGEEFWVKLKPSDLGPPASPEKGDLEVFANVLYEGAKTHFDQTIKGPLSIRKILTDPSRHNSPAVKSKNGGFVKCELYVKRPELMDG